MLMRADSMKNAKLAYSSLDDRPKLGTSSALKMVSPTADVTSSAPVGGVLRLTTA